MGHICTIRPVEPNFYGSAEAEWDISCNSKIDEIKEKLNNQRSAHIQCLHYQLETTELIMKQNPILNSQKH